MGQLYDTVLQCISEPGDFSRFFKVVWYTARGPSPTPTCRATCSDVLSQTSLVVEFHDELAFSDWHRGSFTLQAYIRAFTCEERSYVDIGELTPLPPPSLLELPGLDFQNMVLCPRSPFSFPPLSSEHHVKFPS